jgi:hypothetical protein
VRRWPGKRAKTIQGSSPEDLNSFINKLFNEIIESNGIPPGPGDVYRFDVSVNQDGITITPNTKGQQVQSLKMEDREPLVDVIERKDGTTVISELPGVARKDIELHADNEKLSIKAGAGKRILQQARPAAIEGRPEQRGRDIQQRGARGVVQKVRYL